MNVKKKFLFLQWRNLADATFHITNNETNCYTQPPLSYSGPAFSPRLIFKKTLGPLPIEERPA